MKKVYEMRLIQQTQQTVMQGMSCFVSWNFYAVRVTVT